MLYVITIQAYIHVVDILSYFNGCVFPDSDACRPPPRLSVPETIFVPLSREL